MNKQLLTAALILGLLFPNSSLAQDEEVNLADLYRLCSRFPYNSKCKGFEIPITLKNREGNKASCQLRNGNYKKNSACKVNFTEDSLIFYQEQGSKIEELDDERISIEYIVPFEKIFVYNTRNWNNVYRWEISYLVESKDKEQNITNFLTLITNDESSEIIDENLDDISVQTSIARLSSAQEAETSQINSDTNQQLQQLLETKECIRCDLQNAELAGVNLKKANLEGANLKGANLEGINLKEAYLIGANLEGVNLNDANLGGANLTLAQLTNATLVDADLQGVNFQAANLKQANLQEAYLRAPTFLQEANLQEANLMGTDLRGASFFKADLRQANLQGANLKDTNVDLKNIPGDYKISEILLDQLVIGLPIFGATNSGTDFKTDLQQANLEGANLQEARFEEVFVTGANFNRANLTNAKFEDTDLEEASLCGTIMPDGTISEQSCATP